jgi:hypothetical protein
MNGLEEARGRFAPAPPAESTPAVAPARRAGTLLSRALGRLGPALDATRNLLVSAAIVAILLVIGWSILAETRREAIVVERIAVPRRLGEAGLDGEVLASRLVDAIAKVSEAAFWRGERPSVAMGWKTADFQVPLLGLSMGALVRLVEDLAGRPDRRVSGELVQIDGAETLRLRITPPGGALEPITLPVEPTAADRVAVDAALERGAERLLEKLDPIALAAHRLVARLERLPEPADPAAALAGLDTVVAALNACLIEPLYRERDGERAHLLWATAAWRAALRLDELSRDGREALLEEALDRLALAGGPDGPSLEAMLRRGDVLACARPHERGARSVRRSGSAASRLGPALTRLGQGPRPCGGAEGGRGQARAGGDARARKCLDPVRARHGLPRGRPGGRSDRRLSRGHSARRAAPLRVRGMGPRARSDRPDRGRGAPARAGRAATRRVATLPLARPLIRAAVTLYRGLTTPRSPRWPRARSSTTTPTSARSCWT